MRLSFRWLLPGLLVAAAASSPAHADTLKLLTAGAFKPVVLALLPAFEARTGHTVQVDNDTVGALSKRIAGGEPFDAVVLTPSALTALASSGQVAPDSSVALATVGIGVAVKAGAPLPPVATVDEFRQALLAARRVAYIDPKAGGSSGVYLDGLFERLGVADAVRRKAVLVPGSLVAERLVSGEADLALHQISEILAVDGATLVAPLPAELQNVTTYAGAVAAGGRHAAAARALIATLAGPEAAAALRERGMSPSR